MSTPKTILFLTCAFWLAACGAGTISGGNIQGPVLARGDSGQTVAIGAGDLLTVTLEAQASTGYGWQVDGIDAQVLKLVGREHISASTLGGQDKQILRFAGVAKGRATINLSYRRAWETADTLPTGETISTARTFTATVDVADAYSGNYTDPSTTLATSMPDESALRLDASGLPASYTYCDASTCTPVKNQGICGSCWAFATTGVMEQVEKKTSGGNPNLSEQHLVSCNTLTFDCAYGGFQGFRWYDDYQDESGQTGTVYTADYPYEGTDSSCQSKPHHEKLLGWTQMTGGTATTAELKQAIYDHGPLWAAVCVDSTWYDYTGGVYQGSSTCNYANHAIVLTGWDDSTGTFLLRNSWGSGWGESGYMRIKYGVNDVGNMASYIQYTDSSSCTPNCSGKACGSDGCGGSCGSCSLGQACNASGQCTSSCTPNCSGKVCGSDGCGGSCGSCSSSQTCNASGQCINSCTPNCSGKVCGSNGCGGSCGFCAAGQTCSASGQCAGGGSGCTHPFCSTGAKLASGCDSCATKICAADSYCCSTQWDSFCVGEVSSVCGQTCGSGCTPNCGGKTCGSDGCGGSCGSCSSGQTCNASGQCAGGGGGCTHTLCSMGAKLVSGCDPCATKICAADSYCCSTQWDSVCVGEVSTVCGQTCK
jgi:C1A family cysteine protease